jgi:hypothetical protein
VNRRDFLLLRTDHQRQIVELSCERLYMRCLDARAAAAGAEAASGDDGWQGEPPAQLAMPTAQQLLDDLSRALATADVVRVCEPEWLSAEGFGDEVEYMLAAVRGRGGRVERVERVERRQPV